jgi:hypothetical protein
MPLAGWLVTSNVFFCPQHLPSASKAHKHDKAHENGTSAPFAKIISALDVT